jgi:hypothetical protein
MPHPLSPTPEAVPIIAPSSSTEETPPVMPAQATGTRRKSTRTRTPRDRFQPTHHGKVYQAFYASKIRKKQRVSTHLPGKQRVPVTLEYPEKQRVSKPELKKSGKFSLDCSVPFSTTTKPTVYRDMYIRYREALKQKRDTRVGWSDMFKDLFPIEVHQLFAHFKAKRRKTHKVSTHTVFDKAMSKPDFPPIFP